MFAWSTVRLPEALRYVHTSVFGAQAGFLELNEQFAEDML